METRSFELGTSLSTLSDEEAIRHTLAGNSAAFESVMRRHNQRLFRLLRSILGADDQAMDALQESYIKAFLKLDQFVGPGGFSSWLSTIARNEALMKLRRDKRWVPLDDEVPLEGMNDGRGPDSPEVAVDRKDLAELLEREIDLLPDAFRVVFVMRGVEQMSTKETAALLELPAATVKTQFFRAKQRLRQSLEKHMDADWPVLFEFAGARCDDVVANVLARISTEKASPDAP